LEDARLACQLLQEFTRGKSFADYQTDALLRAAVEREFIVVGEALLQAVKLAPTLEQSISELPQIVGFRNILVHGYAVIQDRTVWGVVENHLAALKVKIEALLAKSES
jgi:uncharacterized protein with HEPN domain